MRRWVSRHKERAGRGTIALRSTFPRVLTEKCHAIREACRRGDSNRDACRAGGPCTTRASCDPAIGTVCSKRVPPGYREDDAPVTRDNRKPQLERTAFRV